MIWVADGSVADELDVFRACGLCELLAGFVVSRMHTEFIGIAQWLCCKADRGFWLFEDIIDAGCQSRSSKPRAVRVKSVTERCHVEIMQALAFRRNGRFGTFQNVFQQMLLFQRIDELKRGNDVLRLHATPKGFLDGRLLRAERVGTPDRQGYASVLIST